MGYKVALDLGTSGQRAQAMDERGKILYTAMTVRHPLPGANIMDHLTFAIRNGVEIAHEIMIGSIDKVLDSLARAIQIDVTEIDRLSVCGNPIQLSLFEGIEIRDLAYAGESLLKELKITPPQRRGKVITADSLQGIHLKPTTEIVIPPAVRHEIGADALAMVIKSGMSEDPTVSMVTDYGTNAEMGVMVEGELISGSAAAGPAIEGQHIEYGMLATPGAVSEVDEKWQCHVLDEDFRPQLGDRVDPHTGKVLKKGKIRAKGITGTGVISTLAMGIRDGIITPPKINTPDHRIHLQDGIYFTEEDLGEATKALGAIRAGHHTLAEVAEIDYENVETMYMCGASGTYVNPLHAQLVGYIPPSLNKTVQAGNTSLSMAVDLLRDEEKLDEMQAIADSMKARHVMFANSETFKNSYVCELAYWQEGMPLEMYNQYLQLYGIKPLPEIKPPKEMKSVGRDIQDIGGGMVIVRDIGLKLIGQFEGCIGCRKCERECPESAIQPIKKRDGKFTIEVLTEFCNGTACLRCEYICPEKVYNFSALKMRELERGET
jgi:methylamine methyltransferase corrinoid protein reductive activase